MTTFIPESSDFDGRLLIEKAKGDIHASRRAGLSTLMLNTTFSSQLIEPFLDAAGIPVPLRNAFRRDAHRDLSELFGRNPYHFDEARLEALIVDYARRIPSIDDVLDADARLGLIRIGKRAFWTPGLLVAQRAKVFPIAPKEPSLVEGLAYTLDNASHRDLPVGQRTYLLTKTITQWGRSRGYRTAKEVSTPVVTPGSKYFGRHDVVLLRKRRADIVIEIDSNHSRASVQKLEFARKAGALTIWVRWHKGKVVHPRGVHVIDLTG